MPDLDNSEAIRRSKLVAEKAKAMQAGIDARVPLMTVVEGVAPAKAPAKATPAKAK